MISAQDVIMSSRINKFKVFVLIFSIFLLDQVTKYLAIKFLAPDGIIKILPFLNFVYVENTGTAFGLFKFLGSEFFILIALFATVFMIYMCFKDYQNYFIYSLIIAGALGNITDRFIYKHVIDFIDLHVGKFHWPAFNIADTAISIGIVIFVFKNFKK